MNRTEYNRKYYYRSVLFSDNIDLKHCGNCAHISFFIGKSAFDECSAMVRFNVSETKVSCSNGLCNIWKTNIKRKE